MFLIVCEMIYQTPINQKEVFTIFCEQNIGDLIKNSANLTWVYPNAFQFMGFIDSVKFMNDPVDHSSVNSSAMSTVNWFTTCKVRTIVYRNS